MTKYQGWTNEQTCLVDQWLGDSFQQAADAGEDITADFIRQEVAFEIDPCRDTKTLAAEMVQCAMGDTKHSKMLKAALDAVDYEQIAQAYKP